ncbi:MAG: hypothetical protein EA377_11340 [Phycisphaerales bacterium]|nr:MAG: hypothetical protein EA377_11340 [Phycisphaerales bacterium]
MPRAAAALSITALIALCGCGYAMDDDEVLVVYSAGPRGLAEAVCEAFSKETGVRIELFSATSGQIMAKLEAEKYNPRADVVVLASQFGAEWLKRENRLLAHVPAAIETTTQDWHDPDGFYHATSAAAVGIAVHADFHHDSLEWTDFFTGRFPGRAIMPAPSRSGSSADFVLTYLLAHADQGWADFSAARSQGLEIAGANSQAITNLLIGSHNAVFGAVDYLIFREIARGEPIVMHFPDSGAALVRRPIAILSTTRVPELAKSFVDFYFDESAQTEIATRHLLPARTDIAVSDVRAGTPLSRELIADMDEAMAHQRTILRRFQYEIERAVIPPRPDPARTPTRETLP